MAKKRNNKSSEKIKDPQEIVIALVSAIGCDLGHFIRLIEEELDLYDFSTKTIRVSTDFLYAIDPPKKSCTKLESINHLMTAGNRYRDICRDNGALANAAIAKIAELRAELSGSDEVKPIDKHAWIIRSLKHPEEVKVLRDTYGDRLFVIGIHASEEKRRNTLETKKRSADQKKIIKQLISRDTEEKDGHGQHTRDTFHLSDFFIDEDQNSDKNKADIERVFKLIFDHPYTTPTFDEFAMYMAFAASVRSADLSRQVGAVLTKDSNIISTGANDVPKAEGGLYWPILDEKQAHFIDVKDGRDYTRGFDTNKNTIHELVNDIVHRIDLKSINETCSFTKKEQKSFKKSLLTQLTATKLKDITEYGRIVHAEMEAILSCGRSNNSTLGTTLYCTTFPCHNCAKHIIASGIMRVVYVEPYAKSKAFDFHSDSISEECAEDKVVFQPFVGVGPRSFLNLFSMNLGSGRKMKRKDPDGKVLDWHKESAKLRLSLQDFSYINKEDIASYIMGKQLAKYQEYTSSNS
ncbi:anti-phage dCTP deaminase [Vibrio sp. Vb2535]|uniref:anti-phage dCTP deaminase n=1 Tax=Vibrio TaxID=662 RepID=UPI00215CC4F1|nr:MULTISPECIES: anti-phage dCTP deaminase [Vibrio]MCR9885149.1 deaminase [Vibrio alginolyticus]MDW1754057.1 anti-phage dCTP deaminase [Vibrio sp. Vb2535]